MIDHVSEQNNPPDDGELLDLTGLISAGLDADEASAVLGPASALTRTEAGDRWEMLRRERDPIQVAKETLARRLPRDACLTGHGGRPVLEAGRTADLLALEEAAP